MNRIFFTALLAYLLVVTSLVLLRAPLLALALSLFIYLLAGLWSGPEAVQLSAVRSMSAERVLTGDQVEVTVTVTNSGSSLEDVLLEDEVPKGLEVVSGSPRHLLALPGGGSFTWSYTLCGRRGTYVFTRLKVIARDHLGLVKVRQYIQTSGRLFILPPVLRLRRIAIRPRRTRVYSGMIPARQGGPGLDFFEVREYQVGDPQRWINWHAAARHPQELYSNQFEQERVADVGIILDGRRRTNEFGDRSIFEHSVMAVASLSDAFLTAGNRVGMLFYGKHVIWTFPDYGRLQRERILQDLSRLEVGDSQAFKELYVPRRLFPPRSQLVLVSTLQAEDYEVLAELRMTGYHILVVSPDPVSFERSSLPETEATGLAVRIARMQRAVIVNRLRGAGIQVVDWDVSRPFEQVARRDLERRTPWFRGEHL